MIIQVLAIAATLFVASPPPADIAELSIADAKTIVSRLEAVNVQVADCYLRKTGSAIPLSQPVPVMIEFHGRGSHASARPFDGWSFTPHLEDCLTEALADARFSVIPAGKRAAIAIPSTLPPLLGPATGPDDEPKGSLARQQIEDTLGLLRPELKKCYDGLLARNASLGGTVTPFFVVRGDGRVNPILLRVDTVGDPKLTDCVVGQILSARFPKPRGGGFVVVTYPYVFYADKPKPKPDPKKLHFPWNIPRMIFRACG